MGNTTHYTVRCGNCNSNKIYDGYSESSFDEYRNSSIYCQSCNSSISADNSRRARLQAEREAEDERIRIQQQKDRLEELERQRLERQRKEREHQRELEEERVKQEHERELAEIEAMKQMTAKKEEEIRVEAERIKKLNETRKSKKKSNNPFIRFKNLDTVNTVKEIYDRVETCSVVGEIIKEQHTKIANELIKSLNSEQYSVIKPEMDRYKKYGDTMANMKNEFVKTFEDAFNDETDDIDDLFEEIKQDPDSTGLYMEEMKSNFVSFRAAINTMESKLFLMEQYYDRIILDYENFIELCGTRKMENTGIPAYLKTLADGIKNRKRDVFEGINAEYFKNVDADLLKNNNLENVDLDEFKQKTEFNVDYTAYQNTETTSTDLGKLATGAGVGAIIGGCAGGLAGGIIGGLVAGPAGAAVGCFAGVTYGAMAGAIIGAHIAHEEEYCVEEKELTKTYTVFTDKQTYDGKQQAEAIEKIIEALKEPLEKYAKDLEANQETANQELIKCDKLKADVITMSQSLKNYKKELHTLMGMDTTPNQAQLMTKKWRELKRKVQQSIDAMQ